MYNKEEKPNKDKTVSFKGQRRFRHPQRHGVKWNFKKIKHTLDSIRLCIEFPFLYPRNRFTGYHYNNWRIQDKLYKLYPEAFEVGNEENGFKKRTKNYWKALQYNLLKCYHNNILQVFHCIPTYTELDALKSEAPGWHKAFGLQICREIKRELLANGGRKRLRAYRIMQIKEKWGGLRWYDSWSSDGVLKIINKYENLSVTTCIDCGKPAKYRTIGYILPYCENCLPKNHDFEAI